METNAAKSLENAPVVLRLLPTAGGPAGNRRDDADGRGSGINDIGQLGARNFVGIGDRFHNRTDGKAIEIVIDENERTQTAGGQQGRPFGS